MRSICPPTIVQIFRKQKSLCWNFKLSMRDSGCSLNIISEGTCLRRGLEKAPAAMLPPLRVERTRTLGVKEVLDVMAVGQRFKTRPPRRNLEKSYSPEWVQRIETYEVGIECVCRVCYGFSLQSAQDSLPSKLQPAYFAFLFAFSVCWLCTARLSFKLSIYNI